MKSNPPGLLIIDCVLIFFRLFLKKERVQAQVRKPLGMITSAVFGVTSQPVRHLAACLCVGLVDSFPAYGFQANRNRVSSCLKEEKVQGNTTHWRFIDRIYRISVEALRPRHFAQRITLFRPVGGLMGLAGPPLRHVAAWPESFDWWSDWSEI